ncbi:MAG: extracellular solute-binding protein [Anaerolineae bacterium]|nr:extracellular solute-binding protein [Anaerolineae bacterium]
MAGVIRQWLAGTDWLRVLRIGLALPLLVVAAFYGWMSLDSAQGPVHLQVYAFSTQEEALTQGIFPAFEQAWEAETDRDLTIEGVFGASGTLAGQINLGAPADVAILSNAQHVAHLKVGRRVRASTEPLVVALTPMVIVTRPGNPWQIAGFDDLAQPGLRLLHADPRSSGAGQWAVLAEYGSALLSSGDQADAEARLRALWHNVHLLGSSARSTMALFELGAGDAFVTYEQDALMARERGSELQVVVPLSTIIAQHVAVLVDDNVKLQERAAAEAFMNYLTGQEAQAIFRRYSLRPVADGGEPFAPVARPFTVDEMGGWSRAYVELIEELWIAEIEPRLELEAAPSLLEMGE